MTIDYQKQWRLCHVYWGFYTHDHIRPLYTLAKCYDHEITRRKGGPFAHKKNTNLTPFCDQHTCHEGLQPLSSWTSPIFCQNRCRLHGACMSCCLRRLADSMNQSAVWKNKITSWFVGSKLSTVHCLGFIYFKEFPNCSISEVFPLLSTIVDRLNLCFGTTTCSMYLGSFHARIIPGNIWR